MVYNIGGLIATVGAGIRNEKIAKLIGNPIFPTIAVSVFVIIMLTILTLKSEFDGKWKLLSVFAIVALAGIAGILFLNRYMAKKITYGGFTGGNAQLPNPSFFLSDRLAGQSRHPDVRPEPRYADIGGQPNPPRQQESYPTSVFDDLFNQLE